MSHFYKFLFCLLYLLLFKSLQINLALAAENTKHARVSQTKSAINKDQNDSVYMVRSGYRPAQHTLAKYVVSIRRKDNWRAYYYCGAAHYCGGAIVHPKMILTAGHCLIDYEDYKLPRLLPRQLLVAASSPMRLCPIPQSQFIRVRTVLLHHEFDDYTLSNDIGLMVLEKNIHLDDKFAEAIPLAPHSPVEGEVCTTLGWGRLYWKGPHANEILYVDVTILDRWKCNEIYAHFSGKQLCGGDPNDSEKDVCLGDSGGPLICNGFVVGIVSFANSCGDNNPTVYTNVFSYLKWLNSQLKSKRYFA